jgi:phage tail-like protein
MAISSIDRFSTIQTDPLRIFRFKAEFSQAGSAGVFNDKLVKFSGGFNSIGGLTTSINNIQYREGGYNTTMHNIPGMVSFTPITLRRGTLFGNDEGITWMRGLFAATSGEGIDLGLTQSATAKDFRCNIKIYVMDHPNTSDTNKPRLGFLVRNAWVQSINFSDLNAAGNEVLFETLTLVHEGFSAFFTDTTGKPVDPTFSINGA